MGVAYFRGDPAWPVTPPLFQDGFVGTPGTPLPTYDANYVAMTGVSTLQINAAGTSAISPSGTGAIIYNSYYGPNGDVWCRVGVPPANDQDMAIMTRTVGEDDIATLEGFMVKARPTAGTDRIIFEHWTDSGTFELYNSVAGHSWDLNDRFGMRVIDYRVYLYSIDFSAGLFYYYTTITFIGFPNTGVFRPVLYITDAVGEIAAWGVGNVG